MWAWKQHTDEHMGALRFTLASGLLSTVRPQLHLFLGLHVASVVIRKQCAELVCESNMVRESKVDLDYVTSLRSDLEKGYATEVFSITIGNDFLTD